MSVPREDVLRLARLLENQKCRLIVDESFIEFSRAGAAGSVETMVEACPNLVVIKSPMVGTYYASASPGAAPYVQVGDRVNEGDTLCIIEAMKMMNQIEADVSGVIKSIRVQNGEPIEYGQTLFVIDQRTGD